jgi:hypothetical protein
MAGFQQLPQLLDTPTRWARDGGAFAVRANLHLDFPATGQAHQTVSRNILLCHAIGQKSQSVAGQNKSTQTFGHVGLAHAVQMGTGTPLSQSYFCHALQICA